MPRYIVLYNWTDQGLKNVKESPKRMEAGKKAGEAYGVKLREIYSTMGMYDFVFIIDAPDESSLASFLLACGSLGTHRSTTLRAFTEAEFAGIVNKIK